MANLIILFAVFTALSNLYIVSSHSLPLVDPGKMRLLTLLCLKNMRRRYQFLLNKLA